MKANRAEGGLVLFYCPGCRCHHGPRVEGVNPWQWNGSLESPTFSPSIKVEGTVPVTDEDLAKIMAGEKIDPKPLVCHSYIRDGKIEYLSDCTHELAGQTVEIPDLDKEQESDDVDE